MTEREWLECTSPQQMLESLRGKASDRKLRLLAAACCRRVWHLLEHSYLREAVMVAERFADGRASPKELENACLHASHVTPASVGEVPPLQPDAVAFDLVRRAAIVTSSSPVHEAMNLVMEVAELTVVAAAHSGWEERTGQSEEFVARYVAPRKAVTDLLRDAFGVLPFRPLAIAPAVLTWNEDMVPRLTQAIWERRAFDRMPILGDALEEAGCTSSEILEHCRGQAVHAPGCWVVDLVLGKS